MTAYAVDEDAFVRHLQEGWLLANPPNMQRLSVTLYRLLGRGVPVTREQLASECGVAPERIDLRLEDIPPTALEFDVHGAVTAFGGLSLTPARHRFVAGGIVLHTWCVFDALFLPEVLGKPAILMTQCPASGAKLSVELEPGQIRAAEPSAAVMSIVTPDREACCDNLRRVFCNRVNLFRDAPTFIAWSAGRKDVGYVTLERAQHFALLRNTLRYPDFDLGVHRASELTIL